MRLVLNTKNLKRKRGSMMNSANETVGNAGRLEASALERLIRDYEFNRIPYLEGKHRQDLVDLVAAARERDAKLVTALQNIILLR
jgi:hypothetical protein